MKIFGKHSLLIYQLLFSALLIAGLTYIANPQMLLRALAEIAPKAFVFSIAILVINHLLGACRLYLILRAIGIKISLRSTIALTWLGLFASNFLPSSIGGDAVVAAVMHRLRQSLGRSVFGLVLNRFISVCGLALLLPTVLLIPGLASLHSVVMSAIGIAGIAFVVVVVIIIVCAVTLRHMNRVKRLVGGLLVNLRALLQATMSSKRTMAIALLISISMMFTGAFSSAVLAWSQIPSVSYATLFGIFLVLMVVQLLPITFNGIGLLETASTFCFVQIGWPVQQAVALSLAFRLVAIAVSLPGALAPWLVKALTKKTE